MSTTKKSGIGGRNYEFVPKQHTSSGSTNSLTHVQDVTEQVLSGSEPVNYKELLDSLEETYELNRLSGYENPEEVRISYHISGSGSTWNEAIQVDVDEINTNLNWIPDCFSPVKDRIESSMVKWSLGKGYLATEETHTHLYHGKDVSRCEIEQFIDSFRE